MDKKGFWDFDFGDVFGPALTVGASLFGNIAQGDLEQEKLDQAQANREADNALAVQLEQMRIAGQLAAAGAAFHPELTENQKLQGVANQQNQYLAALNSLISNYRGALGR